MTFNQLVHLLQEDKKEQSILFLEDDEGRSRMIEVFMKKHNPCGKYLIIDNNKDAMGLIEQHYNDFTDYSLDYNLKMETSEAVAKLLRLKGNDGTNVWIHSNDGIGADILQEILPQAKIKQVPDNILSMIPKIYN